MSNELENFWAEVQALRACPWDLPTIPSIDMHELLERLWMDECLTYQVDREIELIRLVDEGVLPIDGDDIGDLHSMLKNINTWHSRAVETFKNRTRRFAEMRLADSADYSKHTAPPGMNDEQVVAATRGGSRSLLFNSLRTDTLEQVMFFVLAERWRDVLVQDDLRVFVDVGDDVGATRGVATSCLAVEINTSTPISHVYPVGQEDLRGDPPLHGQRFGPLLRSAPAR